MTASNGRRSVVPQSAIASRAVAVLGAAVAKLSIDQQRRLVKHRAALLDLVAKVLAQLDAPDQAARAWTASSSSRADRWRSARVKAWASCRPRRKAAAGCMIRHADAPGGLGPVEIERSLGIPVRRCTPGRARDW